MECAIIVSVNLRKYTLYSSIDVFFLICSSIQAFFKDYPSDKEIGRFPRTCYIYDDERTVFTSATHAIIVNYTPLIKFTPLLHDIRSQYDKDSEFNYYKMSGPLQHSYEHFLFFLSRFYKINYAETRLGVILNNATPEAAMMDELTQGIQVVPIDDEAPVISTLETIHKYSYPKNPTDDDYTIYINKKTTNGERVTRKALKKMSSDIRSYSDMNTF